jgi:hypothetical protein
MQVTIVDGDDWEGLYVDGRLVTEGHRVSVTEALNAVGVSCEVVYADDHWLEEVGRLPDQLRKVRKC